MLLLFAQSMPIPDAEALATKGTPYVLAVCVIGLSAALVYVFRLYRSDMKEKRTEFTAEIDKIATLHDAAESRWRGDMKELANQFTTALKEQRGEFHTALKEVVSELKDGMAEIKDGMKGMSVRLDKIEDTLDQPIVR